MNRAEEIKLKHSSEYRKGRYDQQHPEEDDLREDGTERSHRAGADNNINILERRSMPVTERFSLGLISLARKYCQSSQRGSSWPVNKDPEA